MRPWKPPSIDTTLRRPVVRRAILIAASFASAPELHRNDREMPSGAVPARSRSAIARTSFDTALL